MDKTLPPASTNFHFSLMTLIALLLGAGVSFFVSESFLVNLPQISLVAIACSLLWALVYSLKNHTNGELNLIEVAVVVAILLFLAIVNYYQLPQWEKVTFSTSSLIIWPITYLLIYKFAESINAPEETSFVFENDGQQRIAFHDIPKKRITKDHVAFRIDNDGLDPQIIFNIEKTGAEHLIQVEGIAGAEQFSQYLSEYGVKVQQVGNAIAGVALMEMQYNDCKAYYQIVEDLFSPASAPLSAIDIALLSNSEELNRRVEQALLQMFTVFSPEQVKKLNPMNYQAMFKFYAFVKKLSNKENRCIDYLSFYHGKFEISNSEYVELYNCNLHSSLISWINKDGLIRTDYVDEEEKQLTASERESLQTIIGMPFQSSRLLNIEIIKRSEHSLNLQLYLTFAEINDDELTGNLSNLSLLVKGKDIMISREPLDTSELISIEDYFKEKTQTPFYLVP